MTFKVGTYLKNISDLQISIVTKTSVDEGIDLYQTIIIRDYNGMPYKDHNWHIWTEICPESVRELTNLEKALL